MKIFAPVKGYTGDGYGLHFADGVAETNDVALAGYLEGLGYGVEGEKPPAEKPGGKPAPKRGKPASEKKRGDDDRGGAKEEPPVPPEGAEAPPEEPPTDEPPAAE